MPAEPSRILIVEDDSGLAELLSEGLRRQGLQVDAVGSGRDCLFWPAIRETDLLMVDYSLPDMTGAVLIEELRSTGRLVPFIVITGHGDEDVAVRLMKLGALDYLLKDVHLLDRLPRVVARVLKEIATSQRLAAAELAVRESEKKYRSIVETAGEGIWTVDENYQTTFVNRRLTEMLGYTAEEMIGRAPDEFMFPEDLPDHEIREAERRQGIPGQNERRYRRKDGTGLWTLASKTSIGGGAAGPFCGAIAMLTDITARKQAEEAMRESEAKLRAIFECTRDAIGVSTRGVHVFANPAYLRLFGFQKNEEIIGRSILDLIAPSHRSKVAEEIQRRAAGEPAPRFYEARGVRTDGAEFDAEVSVSTYELKGEIYSLAIIRDVTERKQAEMALVRNDAELTAIYDHAPVMMLLIDADRKVRRLNRAALEFAGKTSVESSNQRSGEVLGCLHALDDPRGCGFGPDCDACVLRNTVLDTLHTGATRRRIETQPRFVRGSEIVEVTLLASTARVLVGQEAMVLLCLEDISQQKLAEYHVREQAALLDVTQDAIFVLDPDGVITFWNRGAERVYGWTASEAVGRKIADLFPDADQDERESARRALWDRGEWMGELRRNARAGNTLIIQRRSNLLRDPAGEPRGFLIVDTDITEAKQIEARYLRAQRLESLGSLAGGVAHDLNNVFTPIMVSLEMLGSLAREPNDREMVQLLGDSARRGADIVRQLLLFSRGSDSPRAEVRVALVIRDTRRMMQETFPKNLTLSIQAPTDLWSVHGDQTQLHQVLLNLCVNARDAMPQGGRLTVTAENTHVHEEFASRQLKAQPGPHVILRVTDTGIGIRPEIIEKIFDPFFTTKPPGQGTGLGLATVLGIVRSHGGFVTVKSKEGAGSEFSVYLPAKVSTAEVPSGRAVPQMLRGRGEFVLVVDDEANIRFTLDRVLMSHGYEVVCVSNGAEALAFVAARQRGIQLLVTDVMMPTMGGIEAVRALRAIYPQLAVVAISGLQALRAEFDQLPPPRVRHLAKPFSIEGLLAVVREALDDADAPVQGP